MKRKGIVALPLALLLAVSSLSVTAFADATKKSISVDTAGQENSETQEKEKKTSRDNASGNVSDSSSDTSSGSSSNSSSGKASDSSSDSTLKSARPDFGRKHGKKQEVAEPENAIGKDAAKEKALDDAGLTADQTGKVRSRVSSLEDGTVIYKILFSYNEKLYSYQIDATTGKVLDKSTKEITEEMKNRTMKRGKKDSGTTESADSSKSSDSSKSAKSSDSSDTSKSADSSKSSDSSNSSDSSKPKNNSGDSSASST